MISYITPTLWQRPEFLLLAEISLYQQTYDHIQWIIVSDREQTIPLKHLVPTKIIIKKKLDNVSKARNEGIRQSAGEYIAFLDDDNLKRFDFGEQMIENIKDKDTVFCFAETLKNNVIIGQHHISTIEYKQAFQIGNFYFTEEMLCRKDFLTKIGMFDETLNASEDYDLALRILQHGIVGLVPFHLVSIRSHEGQLIQSDVNFQTQFCLHAILKKHGRLANECFICKKDLENIIYPYSKIRWIDGWRRVCEFC
ncbi:MAG: glycosyltransferase [Candidatus Nanoarchaeia archaeon]|nr:glycosyltransferase [Candidatus Nanoarchaeia archaeon]